jgi:hypothetical protein
MLACMECTPVAIRSIHVLSNLGGDRGGATLFSGGGGGAIATSRHPLAPPLTCIGRRRLETQVTQHAIIALYIAYICCDF